MKKLVRCRICGYVMDEDDLRDVCPACGVLRKMFEPYEDPVEPARRKYLALDIHPVIVHAPQALTFLMMLMLLAGPLLPAAWGDYIEKTLVVMAWILPFTVAGAYVTGVMDGRVRFRKLEAPMLQRKLLIGVVYQALTILMLWFTVFAADSTVNRRILLLLSILAFGACTWLGMIGAKLLPAIFVKQAAARGKTRPAAGPPATPTPAPSE
jgi:rubredoxin